MKVGIIADVHDNLRFLAKTLNYLSEQGIGLLIHCGDWCTPFTMRIFTRLKCPIKAVLGNGDPDIQKFLYQLQNLEMLKDLDLNLHFRFQDFEVGGKRFAVLHGDDEDLNKAIIESQLYDVFCLGHNHIPKIERVGKTLVINSGSLVGFFAEKGEVPITFAIYDTGNDEAEIVDLEKVLGQRL